MLNSLQCVVAPMVSQSDAPFRTLCRKYGATVAYTEMLYSDKVVSEEGYLEAYLPSVDHTFFGNQYVSRPLVVQICGNEPQTMAKCAELIVKSQCGVDAIDINLGCPQDRARDGLFGSFLLDKQHWDRVFACVKACAEVLALHNTPLFCKIRLIEGADTILLTTAFCRYVSTVVFQFSTWYVLHVMWCRDMLSLKTMRHISFVTCMSQRPD